MSDRIIQVFDDSAEIKRQFARTHAAQIAQVAQVIGRAVRGSGGRFLSHAGDGTLAVFDCAADAISASVAAQRALSAERWPDGLSLRVRMGVHAGDIYEIGVLIEPALTRWFVGMATHEDIVELERIQRLIEENNFADQLRHSELDTAFHTVMYQRHYNRHAAELWWKHREVLRAVSRRFNFTLARRAQVLRDHRELIELIKAGEAERAAELVARHVEGSGRHILEQMRAASAARAG